MNSGQLLDEEKELLGLSAHYIIFSKYRNDEYSDIYQHTIQLRKKDVGFFK